MNGSFPLIFCTGLAGSGRSAMTNTAKKPPLPHRGTTPGSARNGPSGICPMTQVWSFPGSPLTGSAATTETGSMTTPCFVPSATFSKAGRGPGGLKTLPVMKGQPVPATARNWPVPSITTASSSTSYTASGRTCAPMPMTTASPSWGTSPCSSPITVLTAGPIRTCSTSMKQEIPRAWLECRPTTSAPKASSGTIPSMIIKPWPKTAMPGGSSDYAPPFPPSTKRAD